MIGIVASRLKERFHRPTVVFAPGADGELRGSGRAISGFHLRDALDLVAKRAPGTIRRFGGHAFAAGLSLAETALPRFIAEFEQVGRERISLSALHRTVETDGELDATELTLALARDISERQVFNEREVPPRTEKPWITTCRLPLPPSCAPRSGKSL